MTSLPDLQLPEDRWKNIRKYLSGNLITRTTRDSESPLPQCHNLEQLLAAIKAHQPDNFKTLLVLAKRDVAAELKDHPESALLMDPIAQNLIYLMNPEAYMEFGNACSNMTVSQATRPARNGQQLHRSAQIEADIHAAAIS